MFDVDIVSEHEPQYWGFETQEEWEAAMEKMGEEDDRSFFKDVVRFVQGEQHGISPGTIGMQMAEVAKVLIAQTPSFWMKTNERI
jgi:hypothetical protein